MKKSSKTHDHRIYAICLAIIATGLALWLRYSLRWQVTNDYLCCHEIWYDYIRQDGHYAFINAFSNLAMPVLYAWYLITLIGPDIPTLLAVKIPAVICDFLLAYYFFRLVGLKFKNPYIQLAAFVVPLFTPTVFLNSAWWSQYDSCYVAPLIAGLYYLLNKKTWLAFIFFGLSFSVKFQMVFIMPFLLILLLRRDVNWRHFLLIPGVYLLSILPAWLRGRPLVDLLLIYFKQAGQYQRLSMNAPTLYSWIDDGLFRIVYPLGLIIAGCLCLLLIYFAWKRTRLLLEDPSQFFILALISTLLLPIALPMMQGRYYYVAEIIALLLAFHRPRLFYFAIVLQGLALYTYLRYFFGYDPMGWGLRIGAVLLVLLFLAGVFLYFRKSDSPDDSIAHQVSQGS